MARDSVTISTAHQSPALRRRSVYATADAMLAVASPLVALTAALLFGAGTTGVLVGGLALVALVLRLQKLEHYTPRERVLQLVDSLLLLVIVIMSAVLVALSVRPDQAKLYRLNFSGASTSTDYLPAFVCLVTAFSLATLPVGRERMNGTRAQRPSFHTGTAKLMALAGLIGVLLSLAAPRAEVLAARGTGVSTGAQSLLYWSATVFVAYCVLGASWKDHRSYLLLAIAYTGALALTGNRTPLAFIAVAILVRLTLLGRASLIRKLMLLTPLGLGVFSYQSIWRGLVSRGLPSSPSDVLGYIREDPLQQFLRVGLDSVEGNFLSLTLLDRGFEARYLDPLTAVLNFVPRQIWAGKPELFGSEIGRDYLGITAGGIFLSGPGYLYLVCGSVIAGTIAYVAFILALKRCAINYVAHPLVLCAIAYLVLRFSVAGDALDIFLSLQVLLIFAICSAPRILSEKT